MGENIQQLYANKPINLDEMDIFLKVYKCSKMTQDIHKQGDK